MYCRFNLFRDNWLSKIRAKMTLVEKKSCLRAVEKWQKNSDLGGMRKEKWDNDIQRYTIRIAFVTESVIAETRRDRERSRRENSGYSSRSCETRTRRNAPEDHGLVVVSRSSRGFLRPELKFKEYHSRHRFSSIERASEREKDSPVSSVLKKVAPRRVARGANERELRTQGLEIYGPFFTERSRIRTIIYFIFQRNLEQFWLLNSKVSKTKPYRFSLNLHKIKLRPIRLRAKWGKPILSLEKRKFDYFRDFAKIYDKRASFIWFSRREELTPH